MGRKIVIVRHGERMDFTFSENWIADCFDAHGKYSKRNLNMPDAVPSRSRPTNFLKDCPLTQIGSLQGTLVGKGLKEEGLLQAGFQIYVSPALRCVETAAAILTGMGLTGDEKYSLKVEPGLFEWTGWHKDANPEFMTPVELVANGFEVDTSYTPFTNSVDISNDETVEDYYARSHRLVEHLLSQDENDILLVAHGASLDAITRQLTGNAIRDFREMMDVLRGVPYAGVAISEKDDVTSNWKLVSAASSNISMRHSSASDFCAFKQFMAIGEAETDPVIPMSSAHPH